MANYEWLRSFLAVYRTGSASQAAIILLITQPAVTQHIAALERAVHEPLFIRTSRRMVPTQRAKELYHQVVQPIETLDLIIEQMQSRPSELPLLRCGSPREYFSKVAFQSLLTLPYRLWFQFGETQKLVENLEHEQLDVVIATQQVASRGVEYHKIDEENFRLVGPIGFELPSELISITEHERLNAIEQWLAKQKWISYGVELPIIRRFWQQCFGKRPEFQATLVVPDLESIVQAVKVTGGMSILPDYLVEAGELKVLWEPPQHITNELWLAYRIIDRNDAKIKNLKVLLGKST